MASLARHPDFLKLWIGHTVSLGGSLVGAFALPLVAILALDAGPGDVALVRLASLLPGAVVVLAVGALVDRVRRRPLLIGADLGRAVLVASVPLAALVGLLSVGWLVVVGLLAGTLTTLFAVAHRAYLPSLLARDRLVEGNSKLQASGAVVEVASFGGAGWLVQALTAPVALLIDAASFVVSALALWAIRAPEPAPAPRSEDGGAWREIRAGLAFVARQPALRSLVAAAGVGGLFTHAWVSMLTLYLSRDLGIEPGLLGMLYAIGGVTALVGALWAERLVARVGPGPALAGGMLLTSASLFLVPLAAGPFVVVLLMVGAQQLSDAAAVVYEIGEASAIQAMAPEGLVGRVVASHGFVTSSAMLLGTALGGILGEAVGPRATMLVGAGGSVLAATWLALSPMGRLRALPTGDG